MQNKKNILVIGHTGRLGIDLMKKLSEKYAVQGVNSTNMNLAHREQIATGIEALRPDIVLHTAAVTDVDLCEENQELAYAINGQATSYIAQACRQTGSKMIYYSTDYVFDGRKGSPYVESDEPNPETVYGKSKYEGEEAVRQFLDDYIIMRIALVYSSNGDDFISSIIKQGAGQLEEQKSDHSIPLKVISDQVGDPTWSQEICRQTEAVLENINGETIHASSQGAVSRYELALEVFDYLEMPVELNPVPSSEYPRRAPRPKYSSLENHRLKEMNQNLMREWKTALHEFLAPMKGKKIS